MCGSLLTQKLARILSRCMDVVRTLCKDPLCPLSRGVVSHPVQCNVAARLEGCLQRYFKHSSFRPGQLATVLHGHDAFVRMATGAGKSLCIFLVPLAASDTAMAIVISPLVGLMDQQVSDPAHRHAYIILYRIIRWVSYQLLEYQQCVQG